MPARTSPDPTPYTVGCGLHSAYLRCKALRTLLLNCLDEGSPPDEVRVAAIAAEMELIQEVQTEAWWQDITVQELDQARRRLRGLVHLIETRKRKVLYTNFKDEIGEGQEQCAAGTDNHLRRSCCHSPPRAPSFRRLE